jgi:hypothetical protein
MASPLHFLVVPILGSFFSMLFGWFIVATSNLAFENSRRRNEERKEKEKPTGL